jgi:hypothetical protein
MSFLIRKGRVVCLALFAARAALLLAKGWEIASGRVDSIVLLVDLAS